VVRRIIDSDNSCLFNAVGYVMEHSRAKAKELRGVIASVVAGDPVTYNEGFLGKENDEYCRWGA
jgi:ubiquitin thioesterase OTU1